MRKASLESAPSPSKHCTFGTNLLMVTELVFKNTILGNSLAVQWLGFRAFTAEGPGSIPGQGTKIPQATWRPQNKNKPKHHSHCTLSFLKCSDRARVTGLIWIVKVLRAKLGRFCYLRRFESQQAKGHFLACN